MKALISVSDKRGIVETARELEKLGFEIISTGGTYRVLLEGGIKAKEVSDLTGFPECLDGRVKTLHPACTPGSWRGGTTPVHEGDSGTRHRADRSRYREFISFQANDIKTGRDVCGGG